MKEITPGCVPTAQPLPLFWYKNYYQPTTLPVSNLFTVQCPICLLDLLRAYVYNLVPARECQVVCYRSKTMARDISIIYENRMSNNCTIKTEYSVIIFSEKFQTVKGEDDLDGNEGEREREHSTTNYTPWMVIRAPTSASFYYPSKSAVGASWSSKTTTNYCGPFPTFPGTTWLLKQPLETDCPMLTKGTVAPV